MGSAYLHARRAVAYHRDTFAFQADVFRPPTGMIFLSLKDTDTRNVGHILARQKSECAHQVARPASVTRRCFDGPTTIRFVPSSRGQLSIELHVVAKLMTICHFVQIVEDFRLIDVMCLPRVVPQIVQVPRVSIQIGLSAAKDQRCKTAHSVRKGARTRTLHLDIDSNTKSLQHLQPCRSAWLQGRDRAASTTDRSHRTRRPRPMHRVLVQTSSCW